MAVKANTTVTSSFTANAREIDFVTRFGRNWQSLQDILGIMNPVKKEAGTILKSYEATVTLGTSPAEGDEIPYSKVTYKEVAHDDLTIEKYAKAVTVESVNKYGSEIAVQRTDDEFLNELQGSVIDKFYTFIQTGTLKGTKTTFQSSIASAIGLAVDKFKKMRRDATDVVVFVNTLDYYDYLGTANITVQTANGIQYIKDFMGAKTVILSSEIPSGTVIATPTGNIVLYYVDPADSEFARLGLNYTVDGETNLLGFHVEGNYKTAVGEEFALMGLTLWAEYLDAVAVVTVAGE